MAQLFTWGIDMISAQIKTDGAIRYKIFTKYTMR